MYPLEVSHLRKTFGKVVAVDDISFKVKKGETFGLLGVNGAGKTTTINMITGLLQPDRGVIKVLGYEPEKNWEFVKNRINVSTAYFPLSDVLASITFLNAPIPCNVVFSTSSRYSKPNSISSFASEPSV